MPIPVHMKIFLSKIVAFVGAYLIYLYAKSLRIIYFNEKVWDRPVLYAHWHQDILAAVVSVCIKKLKMCTMASLSTDGEVVTQFLNTLRFKVLRGSQAKRGREALDEMIPWIKNGYDGGLAVDGSRGPKYVVKNGIIKLAQDTGSPIIGMTGSFKFQYSFSSWDQMYIPYPFSKGVIFLSDPIYVPKNITDEEFENKRLEVEQQLQTFKNKAESYFRLP